MVEIILEKKKNVIISCVYRAPGSNIETFKNTERLFAKKYHKDVFICGDFNLDLWNHNNHKLIDEFIDLMFSMSFFSTNKLNQAE